jgi:4-amino-4-deoxy-L-arabinose transferase-like glycosyltransferase
VGAADGQESRSGSVVAGRVIARLRDEKFQVVLLLLVALFLRLGFLASHASDDFLRGGDGPWYVLQGWLIAHRALPAPLTTVGPLYPLGLAGIWLLFPGALEPVTVEAIPSSYLAVVRVLQCALSVLVVWLAYRITRDLTSRHSTAMVAGGALALSPAMVIEPNYLLTEPVYMALLTLGVWLYTRAGRSPTRAGFVGAGVSLGLAALTRPVSLLFPLLAIPHLATDPRRRARRGLAVLLVAFGLTFIPWSVHLYRTTGRILPQGFASNLWIGSVGEGRWEGTTSADRWVQEFGTRDPTYLEKVWQIVAADPIGWVTLRVRNLAFAILTPHGTSDLVGPSVKQLAAEWIAQGGPISGLGAIVAATNFRLKLVIYGFHFAAMVLALLGAVFSLRQWREYYGVYIGAFHLILAYLLLTALPRYLFPAEVFLWILASVGVQGLTDRLQRRRRERTLRAGTPLPSSR